MSSFFDELKRRKVFRVAIAYVVASWALAQGLSQVLPVFEISNAVIRVTIVLLLIGFPVALALAWAYDVTPQGIQVTPKIPGSHRRRNLALLIAAGAIVSFVSGFFLLPRAAAHKIDKSIAVLPFENLSDEKDNAYFADGMQDDILTNLSKIGDLKVISRTSVSAYRTSGTRNVREIGKALGVATLLEGSVRRVGNRVRVNVQLINADNDVHIWAEDYDRDLTDVFAIQSDLAKKITETLQAKLSPNEKARLDRSPTENSEAYLLYVQAHDYANMPDHFSDTELNAERLYEQATKLDQNFAAAFAGLSQVHSWAYHSFDPTPARREQARLTAEKALQLDPDLPEAQIALGFSYYYGDRDYANALKHFEIAKQGLPNAADAYLAIGAIQRRQGKWKESIASLEQAAALDPKNAQVLSNLGGTYLALRDFDAADKVFDRAIIASPQSFGSHAFKGVVAILARGDTDAAANQFALVPMPVDLDGGVTGAHVWLLTFQHKYSEALQTLQKFRGEVLNTIDGSVPKSFLEGLLYCGLGDKPKAQTAFEYARTVAEHLVHESPDDAPRHAILGQILSFLGEKDAAIAEGKRAVELLPESEDAYGGPQITLALASIYTWTGEHDKAIQLLDHLLGTPNGICLPVLKLDPTWDPLRKDPGYQKLLDKYAVTKPLR